jgi:hypothetical protein
MIFEYSVQKTFNESIDVVDIGNTALRCCGAKLDVYYMILKTIMGKTHIIKFGPIMPDIDVLFSDFSVSYKKIDYKEPAISKEVNKFINDFQKEITLVEEVTEYEAWQDFPDIHHQFDNV